MKKPQGREIHPLISLALTNEYESRAMKRRMVKSIGQKRTTYQGEVRGHRRKKAAKRSVRFVRLTLHDETTPRLFLLTVPICRYLLSFFLLLLRAETYLSPSHSLSWIVPINPAHWLVDTIRKRSTNIYQGSTRVSLFLLFTCLGAFFSIFVSIVLLHWIIFNPLMSAGNQKKKKL